MKLYKFPLNPKPKATVAKTPKPKKNVYGCLDVHRDEISCLMLGAFDLQAVEEDFVEMRKDDPQSMSAEDLHRLLVVAR